jgi:hypothetical protein
MHKKQIGELFVVGYQGEVPSYDFLSSLKNGELRGDSFFSQS